MAGFLFKFETPNGELAEPSSFSSAVPNWGPGETIHFGHKTLRVVASETTTPTSLRCWSLRMWPNERLAQGSHVS